MRHIPQTDAWVGAEELREVQDCIERNWITEGQKTALFEQMFAAHTGAKHAIAVPNGTIALFLALRAAGVRPGDEVVVPAFTFIATSNAVELCGAEPVPVDVDPRTFNLDAAAVARAVTPRTRAIVPVHIYGQSADMDAVQEVAARHGLAVVEDAAESLGTSWRGRHTGTLGLVGAFSFYGNKVITTGEGGMVTTDDDAVAEAVRRLKNHGRLTKGHFHHDALGFNFRFTDLQAAVGVAQMRKLPVILARRQEILAMYEKHLQDLPGVEMPHLDARSTRNGWFANVLVQDPQRLLEDLARLGVQTRRFFPPLPRQPCYAGKWTGAFPGAEAAYARGLSLPTSSKLTDDDVAYVAESIRKCLA